jgi:hypothetical protein
MKKVYLLLRNNVQSGPFTIDELLQQQLKPGDLVWKEGHTAWLHPFEMDEFQITITKNERAIAEPQKKASVKRVRRAKPTHENTEPVTPPPVYDLERKAEEIRQRALNYHAAEHTPKTKLLDDELETTQVTPLDSENVRVVFHNKERKHSSIDFTQPITFLLIVVWLGAVWFKGGIPIFNNKKADAPNSVATQIVAGDMHAAAAPADEKVPATVATAPVSFDTTQRADTSLRATAVVPKKTFIKKNIIAAETTAVQQPIVSSEPAVTKTEEKKADTETASKINKSNDPAPIVVSEKKKEPSTETKEPATQQVKEEEKKGGFFKNLFKKKKKEDKPADSLEN